MNWIFYAILSPLLLTGINFLDKYILEREIKNYLGMPIFSAMVAGTFGTAAWILTGFATLPAEDAALILFTGVISVWGFTLYFAAIAREEPSTVIVLLQLQPIIALILAYVLLGEVISAQQFGGFWLILLPTIALSWQPGTFRLSPAFWMVLGGVSIWALSEVLFKFVSADYPFGHLVVFESWGIALGGVFLYAIPPIRRAFYENLAHVRPAAFALIFANETAFVGAKLFKLLAVTLGPVALVNVLSSTQVFFAIGLAALLAFVLPAVFQTDLSRDALTRRLTGAGVMFAGLLLVGSAG